MLGEEDAMLLPELFYEANERVSERADGGGRLTLMLLVTPVNLNAHVVVAPCISCMHQGVAPILTSPVIFIPSCSTRLIKVLAEIRHQECLRGVGEGKDSHIFDSHQLLVEVVILVSAIISVKILNVRSVGSGNAYTKTKNNQDDIGIGIK